MALVYFGKLTWIGSEVLKPEVEPRAQWARLDGAAPPLPHQLQDAPPQGHQPPAEAGALLQQLREEHDTLIMVKGVLLEPLDISVKSEIKEKIQSGKFVEFH